MCFLCIVFLLFGFAFLFLICSPFLISIFCVFSPLSLLFSMGRFVLALCAGALWCVLPCNSWTALQLKLLTMNTGLQLFSGCNKHPITLRSHDYTSHTLGPVFNIPTVAAAYKVSVAG